MSKPSTPISSVYRQRLVVPADAIDDLGHVSNVQYVRWVQDIARGHSDDVGYGISAYMDLGLVFVVRRHEIDYLRPAFEGDELDMTTWIEKWTAATSIRATRIERGGQELARASTTWAMVSASNGRPSRIPVAMRLAFERHDESAEADG